MHDLEFEHLHVSPDDVAVNEVAWAADNVELTTVGIDIGSSTSHLMFARVHTATLLNVDIGGGTTKFALIENGHILATCAVAVGGRLIVEGDGGGLTRIEEPAEQIARALGIELALGAPFAPGDRQRVAARMARMVMGLIDLRQPGELARALLVTEPCRA